jgi:hypothetical protein
VIAALFLALAAALPSGSPPDVGHGADPRPVPEAPAPAEGDAEPGRDPTAVPPAVTDTPAPAPFLRQGPLGHTGWRHGVALGAHSTTFFSKEGSQYTFHSGSLGYLGSLGARGAFLHLFWLWPLQARQDGHVYATANYYRRRSGGDLLLGPEWRWTYRGAEAEAGPGVHGTLIYLPGRAGYRDFTALPLGGGVGGSLRWETRASRLSRAVTVGTYASAAYDFWDPMHAGDLAHGFTFRAGVIMGLGERR